MWLGASRINHLVIWAGLRIASANCVADQALKNIGCVNVLDGGTCVALSERSQTM